MKRFILSVISITLSILLAVTAIWAFMFLTDYGQYKQLLSKPVFAKMQDSVDESEYTFQYNGIGYKIYFGKTWTPDPNTPKGKISGKIVLFGEQILKSIGG